MRKKNLKKLILWRKKEKKKKKKIVDSARIKRGFSSREFRTLVEKVLQN